MTGLPLLLLLMLLPAPAGPWPLPHLHEANRPETSLTPAERLTLTTLLRPALGPLFQGESARDADRAIRSFRIERLPLGRLSALAVQPTGDQLCSPTGNCSFWIVDLRRHRILLNALAIQRYAVDPSPHGLPDIVTYMHGSATGGDLIRWSFQNGSYAPKDCASIDSADADGHAYPEPKITPHPCHPEESDTIE